MNNLAVKGLNIKMCKCFVQDETDMSKFHRLEVVGRGSETQLQAGKKLNKVTGKGLMQYQMSIFHCSSIAAG